MIRFRCVASIEVAVDDLDSSVMQRPHRQVVDVSNSLPPNHRHDLGGTPPVDLDTIASLIGSTHRRAGLQPSRSAS
jgi:hypothetical protein